MGKRKNIVVAAVLAMLVTGFSAANADSLNNLLQMDVKRASATDTVDVTFYTTNDSANSVVTRKSNNRYVVLLPNTSSSSSATPGIGGVKDLITNVEVKNVNDGMGGYTKVTFETVKPINIKTHMKKTNPLTQAQKDSKAIIAKNTTPAAAQSTKTQTTAQTKPAVQTKSAATTPAASKPATPAQPAAQKTSAPNKIVNNIPKIIPIEFPKSKTQTQKPKAEKPAQQQKQVNTQPKVQFQPIQQTKPASKTAAVHTETYVPKMKFDADGNRMIDLEPRITHSIVTDKAKPAQQAQDTEITKQLEQLPIAQESEQLLDSEATAVETPQEQNTTHFPMWILAAGGSILALGVLYLVFDALSHANEKDQTRLKSFFNMSSKNQARRRRREYYDIVNNEDLNWQEKYKLYTEKEEERKPKPNKNASDMSYVTDMSGLRKAVIVPEKEEQNTQTPSKMNILQSSSRKISAADINRQKVEKSHEEIVREKLQAKISQMEHALAQTPELKEPEEISNDVKSEDNVIMHKISDIKLKSFSKPVTLKETHRTLAEEEKKVTRNKSYKEGRFVKLKNSPLSVSRRQSASSDLQASDLIGTGNKYLTNSGEMKMNKENENYLVSSLDEYLSILDSEETSTTAIAKAPTHNLSQIKSSTSEAMSRSGVTNPIARGSSPMTKSNINKPLPYMNGLIVKSGYNIDSEKGFYVVNIDGVSALVGRIKDSIFILKKFDHVVDKPLQVRPDSNNVYIVRVGKFKCLVDVSKEKMGTLIEI